MGPETSDPRKPCNCKTVPSRDESNVLKQTWGYKSTELGLALRNRDMATQKGCK